MEQHTKWRLEVNNPIATTEWQLLWEFGADQLATSQELTDELNKINAPVRLRIVLATEHRANDSEHVSGLPTKETALRLGVSEEY